MSTKQKIKPHQSKATEKDILFRKSFVFVLDLIEFTELLKQKKKKSLAKQILKAGTTFGEIINEARFTENKDKYICKIKKLQKNALNIRYLLQLCKYSSNYSSPNELITDLNVLIVQISRIIEKEDKGQKYKDKR